jgi:hypothetical protein
MEIGKSKVENGIKEMDRGFSPILISLFQPAILLFHLVQTKDGRKAAASRRTPKWPRRGRGPSPWN